MMIALLVNVGVVWMVVQAVRSLIRERRTRAERTKNQEELVVSSMAGLAVGAMFLGLQAIVNPDARHAVVEILEEKSLDDSSGEEPPGGREFHEGLRRIRRGEGVEELTFRLGKDDRGASAAAGVQEET